MEQFAATNVIKWGCLHLAQLKICNSTTYRHILETLKFDEYRFPPLNTRWLGSDPKKVDLNMSDVYSVVEWIHSFIH